ncbi:glycosyltransferase [Alistipes sp.]|uniref:glycosyltransferase n=1 Tax=Alistipes sp. TaxID=1872444 RepID=UPI003AF189E4
MKALFLTFHGFSEHNGITKKIRSQVEALRRNGVETHLCYLRYNPDGSHTRMIDDGELETYPNSIAGKIQKRIRYRAVTDYALREGIGLVYIRGANNCNPYTVAMVRRLKRGGAKVVYEIPTYPYDGEFKASSRKNKARLQVDKLCRTSQAAHLDYIVTYANVPRIFGAPTIPISNGIDFDKIPVRATRQRPANEFNLIGVAELHFWHGFDRVIRGMAGYYASPQEVEVRFHIVGYGTDGTLERLQQMVAEYGLQEKVIFHGPQYGEALDRVFDLADMGVASLGRHRSHITDIKTLKNREYAARGIPFVYSENDSDFDDKPYVLKVPADETPVRTADLIAFSDQVRLTPKQIRGSIAELSWTNQMKKVLDRLFN